MLNPYQSFLAVVLAFAVLSALVVILHNAPAYIKGRLTRRNYTDQLNEIAEKLRQNDIDAVLAEEKLNNL